MKKIAFLFPFLLVLFALPVFPQGAPGPFRAYSSGGTVPSTCTAPALFYKTSTTQGLYQCVAGVYVGLIGSGSGITGSGTSGTLPKFTGTTSLGNSSISDDGSNVTLPGTLLSLQLGNTADGMQNGLEFYGQSSGFLRITAPSAITAYTLTLPGTQGAANTFLKNDGSGNTSFSLVGLTNGVTGTLPVTNGGTGVASTTAYALLAGGTTSTGALQSLAGVGTSGQVLTSNGAGALPTFQAATGGVTGSGTTNKLSKWSSSSALTDSLLSDDGTNVTLPSGQIRVPSGSSGAPTFTNSG